jgi:hypothetical protein
LGHELSFFTDFIDDQSNTTKQTNRMNTDLNNDVFLQNVATALAALKQRLQRQYERAYPQLREIVRLVLEQEEARAWGLSPFPHLILPDLVEAHIQRLSLKPVRTVPRVLPPHGFNQKIFSQPALALCA